MPAKNGTLQEVDGRPALRFERAISHPPERVWDALTDPSRQADWHPTPARFEPRAGGAVEFVPGGDFELDPGLVIEWEPPRLLVYTWGPQTEGGGDPDQLRWELSPHDDGCLLVLVHTFEDRQKAARDGAGWHVCLDALATSLAGGGGRPRPGKDGGIPSEWAEIMAEYRQRFDGSAEEAAPPSR